MLEIFLFRHGEITTKNRYIGATDLELSEKGIQKLQYQREVLSGHFFDKIFCSPLKRCTQTYSHLDLPIETKLDERIREVNFGNWEGKDFNEISANHAGELADWKDSPDTFIFPEGEAIQDFRNRIIAFCDHLKPLPAKRVLIISHGGVIRHMICYLLNLSLDNYLYFQVDYGHLSTINLYSEGGILTSLNKGL